MVNDIEESQDLLKELSEAISNPAAFGSDIYEVNYNFVLQYNFV